MTLLTAKELSDVLKVNVKTLYQWAELGQIPVIKLNGSVRFDLGDIHDWIKNCKKEPHSSYNPFTQARCPEKGGDN